MSNTTFKIIRATYLPDVTNPAQSREVKRLSLLDGVNTLVQEIAVKCFGEDIIENTDNFSVRVTHNEITFTSGQAVSTLKKTQNVWNFACVNGKKTLASLDGERVSANAIRIIERVKAAANAPTSNSNGSKRKPVKDVEEEEDVEESEEEEENFDNNLNFNNNKKGKSPVDESSKGKSSSSSSIKKPPKQKHPDLIQQNKQLKTKIIQLSTQIRKAKAKSSSDDQLIEKLKKAKADAEDKLKELNEKILNVQGQINPKASNLDTATRFLNSLNKK